MKKTLTAALTASMLAAAVLAGCGQKAEAPAETTTEAAAEETTAEETTAEETTAEETEAEAQGVPAFEYTGENAYVAAICDYMKENIVKNYEPADVSIPAVDVIREDDSDEVSELVCNLDDMTAEAVAFASEELFAAGALDVYTSGIGMKKGRQGTLFTCMCRTEDREKMLRLMFLHLTTLGIREYRCRRYKLIRSQHTVGTEYGDIRIKRSEGYGVLREKAEYEDLAAAARAHGVSLDQVRASVGERK